MMGLRAGPRLVQHGQLLHVHVVHGGGQVGCTRWASAVVAGSSSSVRRAGSQGGTGRRAGRVLPCHRRASGQPDPRQRAAGGQPAAPRVACGLRGVTWTGR